MMDSKPKPIEYVLGVRQKSNKISWTNWQTGYGHIQDDAKWFLEILSIQKQFCHASIMISGTPNNQK